MRYQAAVANRIRPQGVPAIWAVLDTTTNRWRSRPDATSPTGVRRIQFDNRNEAEALAAEMNHQESGR